MYNITIITLLTIFTANSFAGDESLAVITAQEIRNEATLKPGSLIGNPLPLVGHWNTGRVLKSFDPNYQLKMIEEGHHLLPWFHLDMPGKNSLRKDYYTDAITKAAALKLPISFIASQWERMLTDNLFYLEKPANDNPNVVTYNNIVKKKVSPFGPVKYWGEVGTNWTNRNALKLLQNLYPNPPLILFVSNNEHNKLAWTDAHDDRRFIEKYGLNTTDEEKRAIFSEKWITRYRELQQGLKDGLLEKHWKDNSKFIGYNAFPTSAMGRWSGWKEYALSTSKRISPWPLAWDGASPSFYTHNWDFSTDNNVWGPMISAMNTVLMKKEALLLNPDFWFELSIWDGNQPGEANDKRHYYSSQCQIYGPKRYGGMVKYAMWLLRPRVVREFRHTIQTLSTTEEYFKEIVNSVDNIYRNKVLKKFWRKGELVANNTTKHPYKYNLSDSYNNQKRWFLLNTNYDAKKPWNLHTQIPVFAIALKIGNTPNREWLIYTFSPLNYMKENIEVELPNYKSITINSSAIGLYYHIVEKDSSTRLIY